VLSLGELSMRYSSHRIAAFSYRVTIEARDGLQRTAKQTYVFAVRPLARRRA
jgi:hypothetical protein